MNEPGKNAVADVGFALSVAGVIGLSLFFLSGLSKWVVPIASVLTLLSVPGLLASLLVLCFARHKRRAVWGASLGLLGSLYVPTILIFMLQAIHENF